jgi:branched-chain amino acid transport system substrate-binding protein
VGKVKDFSPYVAKIRASGADSVITGNWGNDFVLLVKAAREQGLTVNWYTYYAGAPGMLTTLGEPAVGHLKNVQVYAVNPPNERSGKYVGGYREKYKEDYIQPQHGVVIEMLAQAMEQAHSSDPQKVARALEGMTYDWLWGPVQMRADNHQLIQPLFISSVVKVDGKEVKFDGDRSGMGWKAEHRIEGKDTIMPTTCKMQQP